jgi:hypothetical protein
MLIFEQGFTTTKCGCDGCCIFTSSGFSNETVAVELVVADDVQELDSLYRMEEVEGNTTIVSFIFLDELFICFIATFEQLGILNDCSLSADDPSSRLNFQNRCSKEGNLLIFCQIKYKAKNFQNISVTFKLCRLHRNKRNTA